MGIEIFVQLGILIICLVLGIFVAYHHGQISGKKNYREHLFKRAREESFILELEKGFEKYYIKIEMMPEEKIMFKYGHGFSKIVPKERE
jgi:hypothetical protein